MNITASRHGQGRIYKYLSGGAYRGRRFIVNRFKLQAYCKEFPFLGEIIGNEIPDSIRIKRADENLLKVIPCYSRHDGSMGKTKNMERVHFVIQDGTIIEDAVLHREEFSSIYAGYSPYSIDGETVLEAIDRHGVSENLAFIVIEKYYLDDWEDHEYTEEYSFSIYKPPKNTTFGAEIKKARAQALAEVRVEADF
jgi:hypothetical protein